MFSVIYTTGVKCTEKVLKMYLNGQKWCIQVLKLAHVLKVILKISIKLMIKIQIFGSKYLKQIHQKIVLKI